VTDLRLKIGAVSGTVVARVAVLAMSLVSSILTARVLGPGGRGQYYAVMTLAAFITQFGNLGLSSSNTYLAARNSDLSWPLVVNGLWVAYSLALVVAVAGAIGVVPLTRDYTLGGSAWWAVCLISAGGLSFTFQCSVLVANERFVALNSWQVVSAVLSVCMLTACAIEKAGPAAFVAANAVAATATVLGLTAFIARRGNLRFGFRWDLFMLGAQYAARAYLALLVSFVLQRVGVSLLVAYRSPHDVGIYSVAAQIYDVLAIVPSSIALVLLPMVMKERLGAWSLTRRVMFLTLSLMALACLAVVAVGRALIPLLFGAAFAESFRVLLWMLPGAMVLSATVVLSQYLVAGNFPRPLVLVWVVGLFGAVAAGVPLTKAYGVDGAAAAQSIGLGIVCVGVGYLVRRRIRPSYSEAGADNGPR
jgi:enterobacterial common antigen flippase